MNPGSPYYTLEDIPDSIGVKCQNCIFYYVNPRLKYKGFCHRFPPNHEGFLPQVMGESWCGEIKVLK
jgi:hypothetical protein